MPLNDDQFRQIMVGDNASKYGDREGQYTASQIQDGDEAVSSQTPLKHGGNNQAAIEMHQQVRSSWLVMLLNQIWQQRRVGKLVLIQKWVLTKLAMIKEKQSSMVYEDSK